MVEEFKNTPRRIGETRNSGIRNAGNCVEIPEPIVEGIRVNCSSLLSSAKRIVADCAGPGSFSVFTLNLDHIIKLRRHANFRSAYANARYVSADGFPIVWACRLAGAKVDRVTGADLIEPLCAEAAEQDHSVFLFGGQIHALRGAAQHLATTTRGLKIAGMRSPDFGFDPTSAAARDYALEIEASGAKLCFVALGAPKQELFSAMASAETTGIAFVCIGGGLDFLSGVQTRAPRWMRSVGAEWFWRLMLDPVRLGRRYFECLLILPHVLLAGLRKS